MLRLAVKKHSPIHAVSRKLDAWSFKTTGKLLKYLETETIRNEQTAVQKLKRVSQVIPKPRMAMILQYLAIKSTKNSICIYTLSFMRDNEICCDKQTLQVFLETLFRYGSLNDLKLHIPYFRSVFKNELVGLIIGTAISEGKMDIGEQLIYSIIRIPAHDAIWTTEYDRPSKWIESIINLYAKNQGKYAMNWQERNPVQASVYLDDIELSYSMISNFVQNFGNSASLYLADYFFATNNMEKFSHLFGRIAMKIKYSYPDCALQILTGVPEEQLINYPALAETAMVHLFRLKKPSMALKIFKRLGNVTLGVQFYQSIISHYCSESISNLPQAELWYRKLKQAGHRPSIVSINKILAVLVKIANQDSTAVLRAYQYFAELKEIRSRPGIYSYTLLLQAAINSGKKSEVDAVVNIMEKEQIELNLHLCNILLKFYYSKGYSERVSKVLQLAEELEPVFRILSQESSLSDDVMSINDPKGLKEFLDSITIIMLSKRMFQSAMQYVKLSIKCSLEPSIYIHSVILRLLPKFADDPDLRSLIMAMPNNSKLLNSLNMCGSSNQLGLFIMEQIVEASENDCISMLLTSLYDYLQRKDYFSAFHIFNYVSKLNSIDSLSEIRSNLLTSGLIKIGRQACQSASNETTEFWIKYIEKEIHAVFVSRHKFLDHTALFSLRDFVFETQHYSLLEQCIGLYLDLVSRINHYSDTRHREFVVFLKSTANILRSQGQIDVLNRLRSQIEKHRHSEWPERLEAFRIVYRLKCSPYRKSSYAEKISEL
jgi:hypothetical protein